jgi:hypothetical protein
MKNTSLFAFCILAISLLASCSKSDSVLNENLIGFSPEKDKENVNRILQIRGTYRTNQNLPRKSSPITIGPFTFNPSEPYIIRQRPKTENDTIEIGNETQAFIPIKFTNVDYGQYFKPVTVYFKVTGAKGVWKIPFERDISQIAGSISLAVPALVREGGFRVTLCAELACIFPGYDTIRVVTDTVNAFLSVRPPIPCNTTYTGGAGLTIRKFSLGEKAGKVKVRFITYAVNDRLEIRHGGKYVVSSCPTIPDNASYPRCSDDNCFIITNKDWREFFFDFDPRNGPFVEVIVLGWCGNTITGWSVNVGCPE